ncbi:agmatine/peptidylarginine deiminase [Planctomycetota bacterium]
MRFCVVLIACLLSVGLEADVLIHVPEVTPRLFSIRAAISPAAETRRQESHPPLWTMPEHLTLNQQENLPTQSFLRMPAEFERQEAILIATRELADEYPDLFLDLVSAIIPRAKVALLLNGERDREFVAELFDRRFVQPKQVIALDVAHDTMWVRDYGPVFVEDADQNRIVVDADYLYLKRESDNDVPKGVANLLGTPIMQTRFELDGGNLLSNGHGLIISTTALMEQDSQVGQTEPEVCLLLERRFGADQVILLEPLEGEPSGHVDMFAMFISHNTAVVGSYDPTEDAPNARILDRNARRLRALTTPAGTPIKVIRIPMPPHKNGVWRTYTNAIFANGSLLVPHYDTAPDQVQKEAVAVLKKALPRWDIVPIDCSEIIGLGGALHCISTQIPAQWR